MVILPYNLDVHTINSEIMIYNGTSATTKLVHYYALVNGMQRVLPVVFALRNMYTICFS